MNGREPVVEIIERVDDWKNRYSRWQSDSSAHTTKGDIGDAYPFVENRHAPFSPARRALPMLNLALISSAGAYIDGTNPFDPNASAGDLTFREIPSQIDAADLRFAARGYDPA